MQAPQLYVRLEVMYGRSVTADIVLLVFAPILFGLLATGAIAGAVFRRLSGDRLDLRRALGGLVVSLPRMLIALGLMIAVLGVFGLMMAILGILSLPLRLASPAVASAVISLLFLLRMLVLYARFYLTIPATVVEGVGAGEAIQRSKDLTEGSQWRIAGMLALVWIGEFAAQHVAPRLVPGLVPRVVATWVGLVVVTAFDAVLMTVTYHDLRVAKEGIGTDELTRVFE